MNHHLVGAFILMIALICLFFHLNYQNAHSSVQIGQYSVVYKIHQDGGSEQLASLGDNPTFDQIIQLPNILEVSWADEDGWHDWISFENIYAVPYAGSGYFLHNGS